jgi:type II secretory pathway pseudopilin PulG
MLVVIAVIGVIAAIAIPNLGNISSSASTATNQRNAQSIVSTYTAGSAAGVAWSGTDRNTKIEAVVAGAAPSSGLFVGKQFKVPSISAGDQQGSYAYIGIDGNGDLFYDKAGTQSSS